MKVCFIQAYRAPDYIRGQTLVKALQGLKGTDLFLATNESPGLVRYWQALRKLIHIRQNLDPDLYVLGFRGHEIAWLVSLLIGGKPLVFDAMMSPYASLREERRSGLIGKLFSSVWYLYERAVLRSASLILTDTGLHTQYFHSKFGIPLQKLLAVPVGAREVVASGMEVTNQGMRMNVLFYGSFLPLHGIDTIISAARMVRDLPICFNFIGGTLKQEKALRRECDRLGILYSHRNWVHFNQLINVEIPNTDVLLGGPFGATPQAGRVVTGKTLQGLASGRATIVGKINEQMEFIDDYNCFLVEQAKPEAIAEKLRWAFANRNKLPKIGARGRECYYDNFSIEVVQNKLRASLELLVAEPVLK